MPRGRAAWGSSPQLIRCSHPARGRRDPHHPPNNPLPPPTSLPARSCPRGQGRVAQGHLLRPAEEEGGGGSGQGGEEVGVGSRRSSRWGARCAGSAHVPQSGRPGRRTPRRALRRPARRRGGSGAQPMGFFLTSSPNFLDLLNCSRVWYLRDYWRRLGRPRRRLQTWPRVVWRRRRRAPQLPEV